MSESSRVAMLTALDGSAPQSGGVEVFNEYLKQALGNLEIFAVGNFPRVGLAMTYGALRAARAFLQRHREEPFDVVMGNGVFGWPLHLAKPGVPLVQVYHCTIRGLAPFATSLRGGPETTDRVMAIFDRLAGVGKHVVAVSGRVLREVEVFYGLQGHIIPNGVDASTFAPMDSRAVRKALGLPSDRFIGIFVGRPDYTKGYDILRRVARQMPDVLFLVAGVDGVPEGNVRPIGRIRHSEMPRWYSASDFYFCPSRYEGNSIALMEALSCDIPAVVTDAGYALPEDPSPCGVVVRGRHEQDFVAAIRSVIETKKVFTPRRFVVPRYSFEKFRDSWRALVESLVGSGG